MRNETNKNTVWLDGFDAAVESAKTFDRVISSDIKEDLDSILKEKIRIEWVDREFSMALSDLFVVRAVEENEKGTAWDWSIREKVTGHLVGSGSQSTRFRAAFECEGHSF